MEDTNKSTSYKTDYLGLSPERDRSIIWTNRPLLRSSIAQCALTSHNSHVQLAGAAQLGHVQLGAAVQAATLGGSLAPHPQGACSLAASPRAGGMKEVVKPKDKSEDSYIAVTNTC